MNHERLFSFRAEGDSSGDHDEHHVLLHLARRNPRAGGKLDAADLHLAVFEQHRRRMTAIRLCERTTEIEPHHVHVTDFSLAGLWRSVPT